MKVRIIDFLVGFWRVIKRIWSVAILSVVLSILASYAYTYLTIGGINFPDPGTLHLVFLVRSYPYHFALPLGLLFILIFCSYLAYRSQQKTLPRVPTEKPTIQERRWLLTQVRTSVESWQSLHQAEKPVILELCLQPDAVDPPARSNDEQLNRPATLLPFGTRITQVYYRKAGGKLLILGEPGAGKTTLLLELARDLLDCADRDDTHPIPVWVNLSSWTLKRQPLADWLVEEMFDKHVIQRPLGQSLVKENQVFPLFDGLDEVVPVHRAACVEAINGYLEEHAVPVVVCCRSADYPAQTILVKLNHAVVLQPLTPQQIDAYLASAGRQVSGLREALKIDQELQKLANSPLMLISVMTVVYKGIPAKDIIAPERQKIWDDYVNERLDQTRRGRNPPKQTRGRKKLTRAAEERKERIRQEQAKKWLTWLAGQMVYHSQTEFYLERMQPDWLSKGQANWLYVGRIPRFFSGLTAGLEVGTMWGLIGLLVVSVLHGLAVVVPFGQENVLAIGFVLGFVVGFLFQIFRSEAPKIQIQSAELMIWSWARTRQAVLDAYGRRIPLWVSILVQFLLLCLGFGLIGGLRYGGGIGSRFGLVSGLLGTVVIVLFRCLPLGLTEKVGVKPSRLRPNQKIWRSTWNSLRIGVMSGLIIGVMTGLGVGVVSGSREGILLGALVGSLGGLTFALGTGGSACLQHAVLRCVLWHSGAIPWNYVRFLDSAAELNLLHRAGNHYVFFHRLLLEHFALRGLISPPAIPNIVPSRRALTTYKGHSDAVRTLSWSPSGTFIASWGDDQTIQVWNASTEERTWNCHYAEPVTALIWSSDDQLIASKTAANVVHFWDLSTDNSNKTSDLKAPTPSSKAAQEAPSPLPGHPSAKTSPAPQARQPSPQRKRTSSSPQQMAIESFLSTVPAQAAPSSPSPPEETHKKEWQFAAWSPDGTRIALWKTEARSGRSLLYRQVQVWNPDTGSSLLTYRGHTDRVRALAWSPDGTRIASASFDEIVQVWKAETGKRLSIYRGHTGPESTLTWSPDGTRIASGGEDSKIQIWQATTGEHLLTYEGHSESVEAVAWSPDGTRIASGSPGWKNKAVQIWKASSGECLLTHSDDVIVGNALAWSPDSTRIASSRGSYEEAAVEIWEATTDRPLVKCGPSSRVETIVWSSDGTIINSGECYGLGGESVVQVWEADSGKHLLTYEGLRLLPTIAWSPDGTRIATNGTFLGRVRTLSVGQWKFATRNPLPTNAGQPNSLPTVAWSQDGTHFAYAGTDCTVRVCDASGATLLTYQGHASPVSALVWSARGTHIASGSEDSEIQIWEVITGNRLLTYEGHSAPVFALAWSPDGMRIASASADKTIQIWISGIGQEITDEQKQA